jgi:hypothetical protein
MLPVTDFTAMVNRIEELEELLDDIVFGNRAEPGDLLEQWKPITDGTSFYELYLNNKSKKTTS